MYNTTADDLARMANDLDQISRRYMQGSQELEQHITRLDVTASHLLYGGSEPWTGLASEAFQGAWNERRTRMQQASQHLSQAAQHLTRFAQTIEEYLPSIRMDQQLMQGPTSHMLAPDDQASILNGESEAQNAIITALAMLNSQLEELAYEVRDCPELDDQNTIVNEPSDDINMSKKGDKGDRKDTANQQEKVEFEYAWKQIQRLLGKTLSKADRRRLHDEITKQGLSPEEIIEIGISMFGDYGDDY